MRLPLRIKFGKGLGKGQLQCCVLTSFGPGQRRVAARPVFGIRVVYLCRLFVTSPIRHQLYKNKPGRSVHPNESSGFALQQG